jgi:hypothetical protein
VESELLFGGIVGIGRRFTRPLDFGDSQLPEGLILLIPGTQLRSGLIEDKAHRERNFRRHQDEKNETLPPNVASTVFIAQFIQVSKRLSRFGALVVRVVNDEAARGEVMVLENDAYARDEELVPGHLAVAKHPGQGRQ